MAPNPERADSLPGDLSTLPWAQLGLSIHIKVMAMVASDSPVVRTFRGEESQRALLEGRGRLICPTPAGSHGTHNRPRLATHNARFRVT